MVQLRLYAPSDFIWSEKFYELLKNLLLTGIAARNNHNTEQLSPSIKMNVATELL
jgi:hypothetical protein